MYDRNSQRYDFGSVIDNAPITAAKVVSQLPWDELPHAAQQYITIRSARIFSDRYVASSIVFTYTVADEDQARTMLIRSEENTLNNNLLWGNDRGATQGIGYIPAGGTPVIESANAPRKIEVPQREDTRTASAPVRRDLDTLDPRCLSAAAAPAYSRPGGTAAEWLV